MYRFAFIIVTVFLTDISSASVHIYSAGDANVGKNQNACQIRDSVRTLFPERECFTLVRPLNNESDLQRLDQLGVSNYYDFTSINAFYRLNMFRCNMWEVDR